MKASISKKLRKFWFKMSSDPMLAVKFTAASVGILFFLLILQKIV